MSRRSNRNRRLQQLKASLPSVQVQQVQGPQIPNHVPQTATVITDANLSQKYLGAGLVGYGPYLQVIDNANANDLVCKYGYSIFRQMSADSEVHASLSVLVQAPNTEPIQITPQILETEADYAKAKEIADFVAWNFFRLPIDEWKRDALRTAFIFGNSCTEIDWDVQEYGDYEGKFIIERLRRQEPENYGYITDRWGDVFGVAPLNQASGTFFPLGNLIPLQDHSATLLKGAVPRYKLSIWTWDQHGIDPRGTSVLIPVYVPWWGKQRVIEEWSCWLGRFAQPSIWGTPGPDAVPLCVTNSDGSQTITEPTVALLKVLQQFRSGSATALPYGSQLHIESETGSIDPFIKSIDLFNKEITRAILMQHLATSEGELAGKAGAEFHAFVLRQLISRARQLIKKRIFEDLIKPLVQVNYGNVEDKLYPQVNIGDDDGFPPTITEVAVLFQAGYFSEDQLPYVDQRLGFPVRKTNNRVGASNLPQVDNANTSNSSSKSESRGSQTGGTTDSQRSETSQKPQTTDETANQGTA